MKSTNTGHGALQNVLSQATLNAGMLMSKPPLDMDICGAAVRFFRRYDM